jgi:hypothetical protein
VIERKRSSYTVLKTMISEKESFDNVFVIRSREFEISARFLTGTWLMIKVKEET